MSSHAQLVPTLRTQGGMFAWSDVVVGEVGFGICVLLLLSWLPRGCLDSPFSFPGLYASLCSQASEALDFSLQVTLGSWPIRFLAVPLTRVTTTAPLVRVKVRTVFAHARPQLLLLLPPPVGHALAAPRGVLRTALESRSEVPFSCLTTNSCLQTMVPDPLTGWLRAQVQETSLTVTRVSGPSSGMCAAGLLLTR